MRIIAVIDDAGVIERILKHLSVWDPQPETHSPAGTDPPWPKGETIPLTYRLPIWPPHQDATAVFRSLALDNATDSPIL